jgi:hypothetical protein
LDLWSVRLAGYNLPHRSIAKIFRATLILEPDGWKISSRTTIDDFFKEGKCVFR